MQFLSWKIYKLFFQLWSVECGIFLICRSFQFQRKTGWGNSKFLSCDCFLLDFYFGSSLFAAGKRDGDFVLPGRIPLIFPWESMVAIFLFAEL